MTAIIQRPDFPSEAEIKAGLYNSLSRAGIDCRLDVPCSDGKARYVLDVVVFDLNEKPVCIIQCRKPEDQLQAWQRPRVRKEPAQYEKMFGLPVIVHARPGFIELSRVLRAVGELLKKR